jgi:transcription termination/antitermination protein NusG
MGLTMAEARPNIDVNWFALTVRPQHEKAVAEQLSAHALEAYVPLYRSRRRWSDRVKTIELPLFPRYVFSRFAFENRLKVIGIPSVTSIVGFGGTPSPISQDEIDLVKLLARQDLPISPWPFLRVGERVRVRQGPLLGVEGILVREKACYRVVVNIEMLNRAVAVELERDLLEPASGSSRLSSQAGASSVTPAPLPRFKTDVPKGSRAGI